MANINVRFYTSLRSKAGTDGFSCEARSVKDVLRSISQRFGPNVLGAVNTCSIFVNSDNIASKKGGSTRLQEGDVVHIFPPIGGG